MKKALSVLALSALAACDPIQDEFYTSGGYVAPLLDQTTFTAVTQLEQFHRYYYIAAIAAPLALYTVSDEEGADDTIAHVARAMNHLHKFRASLGNCTNRTVSASGQTSCTLVDAANNNQPLPATESSYGFELNSLQMQRNLARLATDVKNNVGLNLSVEDPIGAVDGVLGVLRKTKDLIGPLRNFAASYRDTIHITSFSVVRQCKVAQAVAANTARAQATAEGKDPDKARAKAKPNCERMIKAVDSFYEEGNSPTPVLIADSETAEQRALKTLRLRFEKVIESDELQNIGFLDSEAVAALNALMFSACQRAARLTSISTSEIDSACSGLSVPTFDLTSLTPDDPQEQAENGLSEEQKEAVVVRSNEAT